MARIETWLTQDLQTPVQPHYLDGNVFNLDNAGNLIGVKVYSNGSAVTLSGSVTGYCLLSDGTTVSVTGTRSGNSASIILPQSALSVPGMIGITIKNIDGSTITTLATVVATVYVSQTDTVITPSSQVITDWSNAINAALQNVEDAVSDLVKYVNGTSGSDGNTGDTAATAYATIGAAISSGARTIYVAKGTYSETVAENSDYRYGSVKIVGDGITMTGDNTLMHFRYCDVDISGINFVIGDTPASENASGLYLLNCTGRLTDCTANGAPYMGFRLDGCKMTVIRCESHDNGIDGFNGHTVTTGYDCDMTFVDCKAYNNADDGLSVHEHGKLHVYGGEFYGNTSAGIAPAQWCDFEIRNAYIHGNGTGIEAINSSWTSGSAVASGIVEGCIIQDNNKEGRTQTNYIGNGINVGHYNVDVLCNTITGHSKAIYRKNSGGVINDPQDVKLANSIKPVFIIQKAGDIFPQFSISGTRTSTEQIIYQYTITTLGTGTFNGVSMTDAGINNANYTFTYEQGCGNVGTNALTYKFDDVITSQPITGVGAFVLDRSDYTLKIINTASLNENHRVIALFFRSGDELQKSITAFGSGDVLFKKGFQQDFNRFYMQNGNGSPIGALTLSYDSSTQIYTVTSNNDTWFCYGFTEWDTRLVGIGASGVSGITYPMPSSFSSSSGINNFAFIVANRDDNTTSTWEIVSQGTLNSNKDRYIVLGSVYRNKTNVVFFSGMAKDLFTNYIAPEPETDPEIITGDLYKAFKKVGVIGDSLSVGFMYNKTTGVSTARMLEYSWAKVIMKTAGVPWLNLGTSGQGTLTWYSNSTYGKAQAEASGNKCQAYIICLGQNDQNSSSSGYAPLGTSEDITDDYTATVSTYYGGYSRIIALLKHINPDCKIFCVTNPMSGGNRAAYNEAIKYIADTYYASDGNVMLSDLATDYGYLINNGYLQADYNAITGGHYSPGGYARIASIMESEISLTMERNATDMWDIAYIPYDTGDPTANTMTE